jgi:protein-tyrosine phosphatase
VTALLARRGTTIEASLAPTIASLTMPGYLLRNGLTDTGLTALHARLTT